MINLKEGDYTCRAFFPRSLSAVHVETLMRIILQSFVTLENPPKAEGENEYVAERALKKLAENSEVSNSGRKRNLLSEWISQDLSFFTTKRNSKTGELLPFLAPYTSQVGGLRWKTGKGQEGYDKVFYLLARAGRKNAGKPLNKVLEIFFQVFDAEGGGVASDLLRMALREVEKKGDAFYEHEKYQDNILCLPHAFLFQQDIELLTEWKLPRRHQIELFKHLISFHFCAYLVRMAKAANWTALTIASKLDSPQAYASVKIPCISCHETKNVSSPHLYNLAARCKFHPCFSVGSNPSQEWHEVLARYHRNVAFINLTLRLAGLPDRSDAKPNDILKLLAQLSTDNSLSQKLLETCEKGSQEIAIHPSKILENILDEEFSNKGPPKGHAWDFFNRFAPSKEAGFMSRHHRGRMKTNISENLLNSWAHIFCAQQKNNLKSSLFIEFNDFLKARGIIFVSNGLQKTEDMLRSLGLLRQYADMGVARMIEPIFTHLKMPDNKDEIS